MVAVAEVPADEVSRYGIVAAEVDESHTNDGRLRRMTAIVEKPTPADAPSTLAVIGRYVLTPQIFEKLEQTQRGAGGESKLTDAIEALMDGQSV